MNRFLVVGCGGSGGATLQFLMDQLRADLATQGVSSLPKGWQFVHVDVPARPDGVGSGMPPTVPEQGGRYVSMAAGGATYPDIAETVDLRLAERRVLGELATWRPRPERVNFPIQDGAGQYRAVGRVLTLAKAAQIRTELEAAWGRLADPGVEAELGGVADIFSPGTRPQVARTPRVLVISSMAGGSGASMALDVCRLLSTVGNVDPRQVLLMLYTAEVFGDLPSNHRAGVEANAAAMIGELFATQTGAATENDRRILGAFGVDSSGADPIPFRRVIPIGRSVGGDGASFGDGTHTGVFRGIGRSLAAMMLSGVATLQLQKSMVENFGAGLSIDRSTLGWGVDEDLLVWGAFGFASVGLGRDRYAEYAAQRIARLGADRMVRGHLQPTDPRPAGEQLQTLLDRTVWPEFLHRVGLPSDASSGAARTWVMDLLAAKNSRATADGIVTEVLERRLDPDGQFEARTWLSMVNRTAVEHRLDLDAQVDAAVTRWAFDWAMATHDALLEAVRGVISGYGLPTARAALARLRDHLLDWARELEAGAGHSTVDITSAPAEIAQRVALLKGRIARRSGHLQALMDGHRRTVLTALGVRFTQTVVQLMAEIGSGVVDPLAAAGYDVLRELDDAMSAAPAATGQALLRTNEYASWPADRAAVPPRFAEAHNEVLLTSSDSFQEDFERHIRASVSTASTLDDASRSVVGTVLDGRWTSSGAQAFDPTVIEVLTEWWPGTFSVDPRSVEAGRARPPRAGRYRVTLNLAAILTRSRAYVARRDEAFDQFVGQSLRTYLDDQTIGTSERSRRAKDFEDAFGRALRLSRPLVGINARAVEALHGEPLSYYHSFSGIPLGSTDLATRIAAALVQDHDEMHETSVAFDAALVAGEGLPATRIDIFASTANYSPAVFTSLLEPVWRRWSSSGEAARSPFWNWRRSRRLPGAIPAGDDQRRAMIAGWYLGRILGLLRYPDEDGSSAAAVYDLTERAWVAFPDPLLTPIHELTHAGDKLAAVLESMTIALAGCYASPRLEPLRPYRVLREIWDDSRQEPALGRRTPSAERLVGAWVRDGQPLSEIVPRVSLAGSASGEPKDRRAALLTTCQSLRDSVGPFLAPGQLGAAGMGEYSVLRTGRQVAGVPLFHELAPDAHDMLGELIAIIQRVPLTQHDPADHPDDLHRGF